MVRSSLTSKQDDDEINGFIIDSAELSIQITQLRGREKDRQTKTRLELTLTYKCKF